MFHIQLKDQFLFCNRWTLLADLSHKGLKQREACSVLLCFALLLCSTLICSALFCLSLLCSGLHRASCLSAVDELHQLCRRSSAHPMFSRHKAREQLWRAGMNGRRTKESFESILMLLQQLLQRERERVECNGRDCNQKLNWETRQCLETRAPAKSLPASAFLFVVYLLPAPTSSG